MNRKFNRAAAACFTATSLVALSITGASAQSTGNYANGQTFYNGNCTGCHTVAKNRMDITARAPAGLDFAKSIAALNSAINNNADLDGNVTGMQTLFMGLTTTQRGDLAAYIANLATPIPVVTYAPTGGPQFPATVAGSTSSQTVTITNTGTAPLVFATNNAVTIASGGDAADFRVTSTTCMGVTLQAGTGNCTINVTFQPVAGASTTRTASLGLVHNANGGSSLVPMLGVVSGGSTTTPPATTPPTGSANAPSTGGGGTLNWQWLGLLLLALLASSRTNTIQRSLSTTSFGGRANKSDIKAYSPWQC